MLGLESAFVPAGFLLPLIAVLVGVIPGCGPQVLVVTLYVKGVGSFSALIGNAISNDGDALFPAIGLNPVLLRLLRAIPLSPLWLWHAYFTSSLLDL